MGTYDYYREEDGYEVQLKTFECDLNTYRPGDRVSFLDTGCGVVYGPYSIRTSDPTTDHGWINVSIDNVIEGRTQDPKYSAKFDKWGGRITS